MDGPCTRALESRARGQRVVYVFEAAFFVTVLVTVFVTFFVTFDVTFDAQPRGPTIEKSRSTYFRVGARRMTSATTSRSNSPSDRNRRQHLPMSSVRPDCAYALRMYYSPSSPM